MPPFHALFGKPTLPIKPHYRFTLTICLTASCRSTVTIAM
ncbi:Uncharacterised protein [Vibrio cholerae]|nr:Uncharacterised protein [Vibrio cholerae]